MTDFVTHRLRDVSLRKKLTFIVVTITLAATLTAGVAVFAFQAVRLRASFRNDVVALSKMVADNAIGATTLVAHAAHTRRVTQGPRERGCAVQVFTDKPPGSTENIGPVSALCTTEDSRDVCLRELSDQVCLLGGDILWQVDGPAPEDTQNGPRQRMRGRAAHSK